MPLAKFHPQIVFSGSVVSLHMELLQSLLFPKNSLSTKKMPFWTLIFVISYCDFRKNMQNEYFVGIQIIKPEHENEYVMERKSCKLNTIFP